MLKLGKVGFDNARWPDGIWGTFAEGVEFKVRKLTAEAVRQLRKPFVKVEMTLNAATRRMEPVESITDEGRYDDAVTDYLIEDFRGIGDEEGNALPVTLESKKRIMNSLALKEWVWAFTQSLEFAREEELKNSAASPGATGAGER